MHGAANAMLHDRHGRSVHGGRNYWRILRAAATAAKWHSRKHPGPPRWPLFTSVCSLSADLNSASIMGLLALQDLCTAPMITCAGSDERMRSAPSSAKLHACALTPRHMQDQSTVGLFMSCRTCVSVSALAMRKSYCIKTLPTQPCLHLCGFLPCENMAS